MEIPYIPQGTPITVTIEGHWDGLHNGNEPYMTYQGHDGQTRRVHIPHGAYVQTNPEEAPDVAFTVDKTPKHPHDYSDVTDTGEPLDAERCGAVSLGLTGDRACMLPPDGHLVHEAENGLQWRSEDTPRKPEYGDRVRVTFEGMYIDTPDPDEFAIRRGDGHYNYFVKACGATVTVIEPARPAVPDEPEPCVLINEGLDVLRGVDLGEHLKWEDDEGEYWLWPDAWEKFGPLYRVERGPVIGG
jgi:hypothetical protein